MSTENEVLYTEAPASWNVSYVTPEGFVCRITLRGDNGRDLLEKAGVALVFLIQHGCVPDQKPNKASTETKQCPLHNCSMKRFEKDGKVWWSHKDGNGAWCNGRKGQA